MKLRNYARDINSNALYTSNNPIMKGEDLRGCVSVRMVVTQSLSTAVGYLLTQIVGFMVRFAPGFMVR